MNENLPDNGPNRPEALPSDEKRGKREPAHGPKPHWPAGLPLPPSNGVTCFIPEDLAVVLSREVFEQLFGCPHSTTNESCRLSHSRWE